MNESHRGCPAVGPFAAGARSRHRGHAARNRAAGLLFAAGAWAALAVPAGADTTPLAINDPNLQVTTLISAGLSQPIGLVQLGADDFLVAEKASGQVKRVIAGVVQATPVLDLAVNSASERGLLSVVTHPDFPTNPSVYIRWTESSTGAVVQFGSLSMVPLASAIWPWASVTVTE